MQNQHDQSGITMPSTPYVHVSNATGRSHVSHFAGMGSGESLNAAAAGS